MTFYHPRIEYENYPTDLDLLEDIGENKYLEFALSFDRGYSIKEVQQMLPGQVKIAWYWVDTYSEQELAKMKGQQAKLVGPDGQPSGETYYQKPQVLFAKQVYGIKAITSNGENRIEPWDDFIKVINIGRQRKGRYQEQFKNLYNVLNHGKGEISKDDLKIIGAVVTGDTASLKQLRNNSCIKAQTLGIQIDKF